jgi:hypothetical protein
VPGGDIFFCTKDAGRRGPTPQVYDLKRNADAERFPSVLAFEHIQRRFKRDVDTVYMVCVHIRDVHGALSD